MWITATALHPAKSRHLPPAHPPTPPKPSPTPPSIDPAPLTPHPSPRTPPSHSDFSTVGKMAEPLKTIAFNIELERWMSDRLGDLQQLPGVEIAGL